jgi:hypothetical protein
MAVGMIPWSTLAEGDLVLYDVSSSSYEGRSPAMTKTIFPILNTITP